MRQSNYIEVYSGSGCFSTVGRNAGIGSQSISLKSNGCVSKGIIQHEFLHAISTFHEQSRPDRDEYVVINFEKIDDENEIQFSKLSWTEILENPYDYGSVMHYGKTSFSNNDLDTITPLNGQSIGQRNGVSHLDILDVRLMYQCISGARSLSEYNNNHCTSDCKCWEYEAGCNGDNNACQGDLVCVDDHCAASSGPPSSAVCGDEICQVNSGEGCSSCGVDCYVGTNCNIVDTNYQGGFYSPYAYGIVFDVSVQKDLYFYEVDTRLMRFGANVRVYMKQRVLLF